MRFLLSICMLLFFSSAMSFGLNIEPLHAGLITGGLSVGYSAVKSLSGYTVPGFAMEVVSGITGVTKKAGIRIFKPISGVGFHKDGIISGTEKIKIELVNSTSGKTKTIVPMSEIRHLAEICSSGEGQYRNSLNESYGVIDVTSNRNGYEMNEGDYFTVELDGLTEAKKYDIFGIETPYKGGKLLKYEEFHIPAGEKTRVFGVKGALMIALDMYHIDRVKLNGADFSTELNSVELAMLALRDNDIVCEKSVMVANAVDGQPATEVFVPKMGYDNLFVIGVRDQNSMFDINTIDTIEIVVAGEESCTSFILWEQ